MTVEPLTPRPEEGELRRVLGPLDAGCIVVGAVIGVGIFFAPSVVARQAGSGNLALLAWAIGGVIALLGALTFAELGGLYTRSGAQYEVLRDAYGPLPAFLFVFCNSTAVQAGATAIIATVCAEHLGTAATGNQPGTVAARGIAALLIAGLMAANIVGVRWGSRVQNATVFAKIATLVLVTLLAAFAAPAVPAAVATQPESNGPAGIRLVGAVLAGLVSVLFTYGGWQHALWIAGEIREPRRNIPRAIVGGMLVVTVVYLLVNWAYLRLLGYHGVAGTKILAADAAAVVWPHAGRRIIAAAVALSAFGVLNAQLLSGPRLVYGMARDGRFFAPFARASARFATPYAAILLIGCMALILLVTAGKDAVDRLITGVVAVDSVFFVLTGLAVVVLRRKRPHADRPVRVPAYPAVPLLFVLGEIGVIVGAFCNVDWEAALAGAGWIVAAGVCYFLFFRGPERR